MTTTVNDLVRDAYREINIIGENASLKPGQLAYGITQLNRLIDSYNAEKLLPFNVQFESFALTASKQIYTIGAGGDFNTTRPTEIFKATLKVSNSSYPMGAYTYADWMDIFTKTNESTIPRYFYYEPSYPLGKIYLYYVPSAANTFTFASKKQLGQYVIDDTFAAPPGYELMFIYTLAEKLLTRYPSEALAPIIMKNAKESLANVRRNNLANIMTESELDYRVYNNRQSGGYFWGD